SQDPSGFDAGDSNTYRYVSNAPIHAIDPDGFQIFAGLRFHAVLQLAAFQKQIDQAFKVFLKSPEASDLYNKVKAKLGGKLPILQSSDIPFAAAFDVKEGKIYLNPDS